MYTKLSVIPLTISMFFLLLIITSCGTSLSPSDPPNGGGGPGGPSANRIIITPQSLPSPYHTQSANNGTSMVSQPAGSSLTLPSGFEIKTFASGGFENPRWIIQGSNGDLFVSDNSANAVFLLRDANNNGVIDSATEQFKFLEGLNQPLGMAIRDGWFYVANTNTVMRYSYVVGQTKIEGGGTKIIDLPGNGYNQHWTRNILFSKDGQKLYVTVGSESNVGEEEPRRAAINEYNPDGTNHRVFASGLRNPVGMDWNPATGELWTAVNERDGLGDDLVPDFATSVKENGFYGWPYSYIGKFRDPRLDGKRLDLVEKAIVPDVLFEAHAASLGLVFYTGSMFPSDYVGDAFVAMHGSWNRSTLNGYKIARIPFKDGKPEGGYENFVTGWALDPKRSEVWGRPVGLVMMSDGSLLLIDDGAKKIWRITYNR